MSTWQDFWNRDNSIYVSDRHREVHFAALARDLLVLLSPQRPLRLLDWGCGQALGTPILTERGIEVLLYDPIEHVRADLERRFKETRGIRVLGTEDIRTLPPHSQDAIVVNSVLQYLSRDEFIQLLPTWRGLLHPQGVLILGDVVPTHTSFVTDVRSLLQSAWRYGFLLSAFWGLVTTFFSDYREIRRSQGFSMYTEDEMHRILSEAGFASRRVRPNIGLTGHRMLFVATPL